MEMMVTYLILTDMEAESEEDDDDEDDDGKKVSGDVFKELTEGHPHRCQPLLSFASDVCFHSFVGLFLHAGAAVDLVVNVCCFFSLFLFFFRCCPRSCSLFVICAVLDVSFPLVLVFGQCLDAIYLVLFQFLIERLQPSSTQFGFVPIVCTLALC